MQGRGGRPDDGRGWEGRKQRREARVDGSGASAGAGGEHAWVGGERAGVRGKRAEVGAGAAVRRGRGRESGDLGEKRRDEAGRGRILG